MIIPFQVDEIIEVCEKISKKIKPIYEKKKILIINNFSSPQTEADRISNKILCSFLTTTNIPVISEENSYSLVSSEYRWIIDPLDGTLDFINHTGEFSIMIGLVKKDRPIFGLIFQPLSGVAFFAFLSKGAYLKEKGKNPRKIHNSSLENVSDTVAAVSRNHFTAQEKKILTNFGISHFVKSGSLGLKAGLIANGDADVYINTSNKTSIWDTCAGDILTYESGGIMTDLFGKKIVYNMSNYKNENGVLIANKVVHKQILEKLEQQTWQT